MSTGTRSDAGRRLDRRTRHAVSCYPTHSADCRDFPGVGHSDSVRHASSAPRPTCIDVL